MISLGLATALLVAGPPAAKAPLPPEVLLLTHQADLEPDYSPPRLRVRVTVENRLPVELRGVVLGVVFGNSTAALENVDAAKLYVTAPTVVNGVGALVGDVALVIPAKGVGGGTWFVDLPAAVGAPQAFELHLLSFSMADPPASLLLSLIGTANAANEVAACTALGLTGHDTDKAKARLRWGQNSDLAQALVTIVAQTPAAKPTQLDVLRQVFAVRGLGVLGGGLAAAALQTAVNRPEVSLYDEPLQVLRVAQASGSALESPLAFMVPVDSYRMTDVVRAALQDANTQFPAPAEDAAPPTTWRQLQSGGEIDMLALASLVAMVGSVVWWVAMRRRKP